MRIHPALLFFLALTLRVSGQLPNGSIAPDFNVPDINGQYRHLYEMLDQGKIVVLEVSATWCPPCWAYHNSHAMQDFYTLHGPVGDDKARVLFIEGDPQTNVDCLYGAAGCNDYSPGNWVSGTSYPYIDNAAIADSYQVDYYPTIFIVCPNKKTYTVGQLGSEDLWEKAMLCPVALGTNNAGIFDYSPGTVLHEVCDTLELSPRFTLINLGANALTAATINLEWNGNVVQSLPWTGNLALYGEAPIAFNPHAVSSGGILKTTVASLNNGAQEDDFSNNVFNSNFILAQQFDGLEVVLKIRTDNYGAETYWELRNELGEVLDHGGNEEVGPNGGGLLVDATPGPGAYGNGALIKDTLHLPEPGCYSLHFVDAYGDGICCGLGNGYYKLYNIDNPAVPIISGGEFESYDDRAFGVEALATAIFAPATQLELDIYPNPAAELLHVVFDLNEALQASAEVFNAMGQCVYRQAPAGYPTGTQHWQIPLHDLSPGLYILKIRCGEQELTRRFVH